MADEQPSDDLRTLLAASFDESAANATAAAEPEAKPAPKAEADAGAGDDDASKAKPEASADAKTGDDRERDPATGKFVKKAEGDDKAKEDSAADKKAAPDKDAPKADADKDAKPAADAKTDGKEAPARWSASDKAMFKLQSPEAQEFLLRRHAAMEAEFTKRTQAIAELQKEYEPVAQLFAPHIDVLKQKGLTPQTVIRRWADVETALANGRGVDIIDGIVKAYGIDKATLAQRLGFTSTPSGQASTDGGAPQAGDASVADPSAQMLAKLEERIAKAFEPKFAKIDQFETAQRQAVASAAKAAEDKVETEISSFKSAVNEKGELLHPYFEEVEPAMIALAQSYVASKQPLPKIADLYDQAVWANPSTRQALLATQKAAQEAKAVEEARAKAASARRAASSVTGAPGTGQASRPVRGELSLREQLEEAAAEMTG